VKLHAGRAWDLVATGGLPRGQGLEITACTWFGYILLTWLRYRVSINQKEKCAT
jgi:hypothetical protein